MRKDTVWMSNYWPAYGGMIGNLTVTVVKTTSATPADNNSTISRYDRK